MCHLAPRLLHPALARRFSEAFRTNGVSDASLKSLGKGEAVGVAGEAVGVAGEAVGVEGTPRVE